MAQNLFIAGANGGIGRKVVEQALMAGYHVTALVRDPAKLPIHHAHLKIVQGDIMKPETFAGALVGHDAVISALGVSDAGLLNDKPTLLYSKGGANLLAAMKTHGVMRALFVSASGLDVSPALPWYARFFARYILQKLLKHMYSDLREMENIIKASDMQWTILRPPQLTNGPLTGDYRTEVNGFLKNALKISRADTAHFLVNHIADPATFRSTVEIGY
jgi:putative NADH-flavin reductase